jgi:hypothetical protein
MIKGGRSTMLKNKNIIGFIAPLAIGLLLIAFLWGCKSEEKKEEEGEMFIISNEMLTPIFGEGEGSVSGLLDSEQSQDELQISYYFYTESMGDIDDEIEADLAPKIQELYSKIPEVERVAFSVNVPEEGEPPYKPYVSFVTTRELVEKTDWSNLLELEFFKAVMDVKYYD